MAKKKLVICCDGTGKRENVVPSHLTNVSTISRCINTIHPEEDAHQVVYYQPGVGTYKKDLVKNRIHENILEAYSFICHNYDHPQDEIYLIGFSRGAFTVRCLAHMIYQVGLLRKEGLQHLSNLFDLWNRQKNIDLRERLNAIGELVRPDIPIKACAVWDTVSSVGKELTFVNSELCPNIERAYQAISLHEHRHDYCPIVWRIPVANLNSQAILKQCWFAGYHGDVGGGRKDGALEHFALVWIMSCLREHLSFNFESLWDIMQRDSSWRIGDTQTGIFRAFSSKNREPSRHFWTSNGCYDIDRPHRIVSNEKIHFSLRPLLHHGVLRKPEIFKTVAPGPQGTNWVWQLQSPRGRQYPVEEDHMSGLEWGLLQKWVEVEWEKLQESSTPGDERANTILRQFREYCEENQPIFV